MVGAREVANEIRDIAARRKITLPFHRTWISLSQYDKSYELVQRHLASGASVLDWGAGNGHFGIFLLKSGYQAYAFSLHESPIYRDFIEAINERFANGYRTFYGDAEKHAVTLPYSENSFDGVCSIGVLEHVREFGGDERGSLREIRRVLKPGGIFICTHFPNVSSYMEKLTHGHKFKYGFSDIRSMANDTGFELAEMGRYQFLPRRIANNFPSFLSDSAVGVAMYNGMDRLLSVLFNRICTCNYFVFRKPVSDENAAI
jgi:SAM-dependent methyltransferase